jgi:hypothetical protein
MLSGTLLVVASILAGQPQELVLPDDARSELSYLAGSWRVHGRVGDDMYEGQQVARWAPGGHCLIVSWAGVLKGKRVKGTAVMGWDGGEKQIVDVGFIDTIGHRITRWTIENEQVWEGAMEGYLLGAATTTSARRVKKGDDKFIVVIAAADGMPENEYVFEKSEPDPKKKARPKATRSKLRTESP